MPFVSFAVLSDLHLETPAARPTYSEFSFVSACPYLVLLGDIGLANDLRLFTFREEQLSRFEIVFYVLGNHEPYDSNLNDTKELIRAFEERISLKTKNCHLGEFVFLDQIRYDLTPTMTILGCTLFSAIDLAQRPSIGLFVSDFERIQDWSIESHNEAHMSDLAWLNRQVTEIERDEPEREIAIFSHYSPTLEAKTNDLLHLMDDSGVRTAFMTDLSKEPCWTSRSVKLWAFGHTHFNCDFVDSQTGKRVLANQKGYRRSEVDDFNPEKVVTLSVDQQNSRRANHAAETTIVDRSQPKQRPRTFGMVTKFFHRGGGES